MSARPVESGPRLSAEAPNLEILQNYLKMVVLPVTVHIFQGEETVPTRLKGEAARGALTYCQLVRRAAGGEEVVLDADAVKELACPSPELALGFREPKYVDVQPRIGGGTREVILGQGGEDLGDPDVILLILNPAQTTDLALLLGGIEANFAGQMAVCGEATAKVYRDGRANVSFLCHGCRELAGYGPDEVVVGITAAEARGAIAKIEGGRKR